MIWGGFSSLATAVLVYTLRNIYSTCAHCPCGVPKYRFAKVKSNTATGTFEKLISPAHSRLQLIQCDHRWPASQAVNPQFALQTSISISPLNAQFTSHPPTRDLKFVCGFVILLSDVSKHSVFCVQIETYHPPTRDLKLSRRRIRDLKVDDLT